MLYMKLLYMSKPNVVYIPVKFVFSLLLAQGSESFLSSSMVNVEMRFSF